MENPYPVRRIRKDEWTELRALRLRALKTDRIPFGSTFEETSQRPDHFWKSLAENGVEGNERAVFVACGPQMVGMVRAERIGPDAFGIYSMWVAPEARRQGVAEALLAAAEAWMKSAGGKSAELFVADKATAAHALYRKCGYVENGATEASPHPGVTEQGMTKTL